MDGIVHILWITMVTREQLSENRVFDRTRPEYKESAKIALSEGLITDFSDSLGGAVLLPGIRKQTPTARHPHQYD